jgi:hypothetical protein
MEKRENAVLHRCRRGHFQMKIIGFGIFALGFKGWVIKANASTDCFKYMMMKK